MNEQRGREKKKRENRMKEKEEIEAERNTYGKSVCVYY